MPSPRIVGRALAAAADLLDPPELEDPWAAIARPEQLPPDVAWLIWLILAGRGWGKTRTGAEWIRKQARQHPGSRYALVASTFADGRDTMVEGESGLLSIIPDVDLRGGTRDSAWNRSLGELVWANGSQAKIFSSERPGQLRGPQHHGAWCDEVAQWRDAHKGTADDTTWSNLMFGLRLGGDPRAVVTTTPKPNKLLRGTPDQAGIIGQADTVVTKGTTYQNLDNLAPTFRKMILDRYEGTRLGRQELMAELLEDVLGALWTADMIDRRRCDPGVPESIGLVRIVVAVDPAITATPDSDETGIVVAGVDREPTGYVLEDLTQRSSPDGWARAAVAAYHRHKADRIVAEANQGGDMVRHTIATVDRTVPVTLVHATRGKEVRAAPVAALYEQGKVQHAGMFAELEDQMTSWVPGEGKSPDRVDALVWAFTDLMVDGPGEATATAYRQTALRRTR